MKKQKYLPAHIHESVYKLQKSNNHSYCRVSGCAILPKTLVIAKEHQTIKDIDLSLERRVLYKNAAQVIGCYASNELTGDNNTISIAPQTRTELEEIVEKIEALSRDVEADRDDIAEEVAKIRVELDGALPHPKILRSAFNAIKGISVGIAANQLTPLVNKALSKL